MEQSDATKEQKNATRGKPKYRNQFIIKLFNLLEVRLTFLPSLITSH